MSKINPKPEVFHGKLTPLEINRCQHEASEVRRLISVEVWHDIQVLKRQGLKKKAIARKLKISKNTVKRYWHRLVPPKYQRQAAAKGLDPFSLQIQEMVQQRFIGNRIYEELTKLRYTGSLTRLYRYLRQFQEEDCSKATIRFETEPGQQMQHNWTERRLPVAGKTGRFTSTVFPLSNKVFYHREGVS